MKKFVVLNQCFNVLIKPFEDGFLYAMWRIGADRWWWNAVRSCFPLNVHPTKPPSYKIVKKILIVGHLVKIPHSFKSFKISPDHISWY